MATFVKRGDKWQAIVRRKGQKPAFKTFTLKAHAESWAKRLELGYEAGEAGIPGEQMSVSEVLVKFRDEVCPSRKGERWETVRLDKLLLEETWLDVPINRLDIDRLREWRDRRLQSVSGSSVNREMSLIGGVFSYAIKEGWVKVAANPISLVGRPKSNKPRHQRVTDAQLAKIIGEFPPTHNPKFDYEYVPYIAWLAIETAMRLGEICQLTWSDINVEDRTIHVRDEWSASNKDGKSIKNGSDRDVPLSKRAAEVINMLASHREDAPMTARLFGIEADAASAVFRKAKIAAGLHDIEFRDLRREATTRIAAKIGNVLELSAITGHKDLRILSSVYYKPRAADLAKRLD